MARRYSVITDRCHAELHCIRACFRNAIHPTPEESRSDSGQLFINPKRCIGCGACISACESGAIYEVGDLQGAAVRFAVLNAAFYGY